MAAIDLVFQTGLESERLHQIALASLLRHTTLPDLLVPGFGHATSIEWEPRGGTYDLAMTNATGRAAMLELKVDASLADHQIDKQIESLQPGEHLAYVLLGHTRITARPWLDRRLAEHGPRGRFAVRDEKNVRDALARAETTAASITSADARDLLSAYPRHLAALARRNAGFFEHPPDDWIGEHWGLAFGYLDHCRCTIPGMQEAGIAYVPNRKGGFRACYFHGVDVEPGVEAYLQLEEGRLCFKISVGDEIDRSATRNRIRRRLHEIAALLGLPIEKPKRLGSGQTMTLAVLDAEQTGFGLRDHQEHFEQTAATAMRAIDQLGGS